LSITAAHIATKINLGNIGNVVKGNGRARSAGGYKWRYATEQEIEDNS